MLTVVARKWTISVNIEVEMTLDKSFAELQPLSTRCWLKIGSGKKSKIWENQLQFQVLATKSTIVVNERKMNNWDIVY